MSAPNRVESIATERVEDTLRQLANAEQTIARNLERRGAHALAAVHDRTAQIYAERLVVPAASFGKGF
jgi:hypothetical protein